MNLPKNKFIARIYQIQTLTLPKITPRLYQNQTLTLPKIKIRHRLCQNHTLILELKMRVLLQSGLRCGRESWHSCFCSHAPTAPNACQAMDDAGRWLQSDEVDGSLCAAATTTGQGPQDLLKTSFFLSFVLSSLCFKTTSVCYFLF